jgi:hypothetical protein
MIKSAARSILGRLHMLEPARRLLGRSTEHGHSLLIRLLDTMSGPIDGYLVEVGSTREKIPGQGSTVLLAGAAAKRGMPFITVDMDPANTDQASRDLSGYEGASAVNAKGEDFLAAFDGPIAAVYLDAFDLDHGHHSQYRLDRYRRYLGTDVTNEACAQMHLDCARALVARLVPGGLVVIDDTWPQGAGFAGKGATAVPYLLTHGFEIALRSRTAVGLRRAARSPS